MLYQIITYGRNDTEVKVEDHFTDYNQARLFSERTLARELHTLEEKYGEEQCREFFTEGKKSLTENGYADVAGYQIAIILDSCEGLCRKQEIDIEAVSKSPVSDWSDVIRIFIDMDLLADIAVGLNLLTQKPRLRSVRFAMPCEFLKDDAIADLTTACAIRSQEFEVTRHSAFYHVHDKYCQDHWATYEIPLTD